MTETSEPRDDRPHARCALCSNEITEAETHGIDACPACGTKSLPLAVADDVTVKVNWGELRTLGIWAERYTANAPDPHMGKTMQRVVAAITGRLMAQFPDKAPLTMSGEIAELRQTFGDVEVHGFDKDEEANDAV